MAVAALDELVNQIVKASGYRASAPFFDWIADEATPLVEIKVAQSFHYGQLAHSLRSGDPRIALTRWVHQWVAPGIAAKFSHLVPHLPVFADVTVVEAQPVHESVHEHVRTFWPGRRLAGLLTHPPLGASPVAGAARAAFGTA